MKCVIYVHTISIADWEISSLIIIPVAIHQRGVDPIIQVFSGFLGILKMGEEFVEIRVDSSGEVKILLVAPTPAFDGKIIII